MTASDTKQVERWGLFELAMQGPSEGNPFVEVGFGAEFRHQHRRVPVDGFYDGDGRYVVRFMPDSEGQWQYLTRSTCQGLAGSSGSFRCVAPGSNNHGPVYVSDRHHFRYADGTPFYQVGTTCYAWVHQWDELEEQTLDTLSKAPFNKLRMCVFPKHYAYNQREPVYHPFEQDRDGQRDFARFNPAFFHHFEERVKRLMTLGIEADLILFHPYDRWGYATMPPAVDERYLRHVVARLAAFRNVWWSMANEYDLMKAKKMTDWHRFFRILQESDPYSHLCSVHNCRGFYDYSRSWVTHCSIQSSDVESTGAWRQQYGKPVVIDECKYEGNIPPRWGNISAQEMVRRFWEGTVRGGYVGHGETFLHPHDILWWSHGGVLHGESPARIAFLRSIIEEGAACGWEPVDGIVRHGFPCVAKGQERYLTYLGVAQPAELLLDLPQGVCYVAELIDTWGMTSEIVDAGCAGECSLELPGRPYLAVRLRRKA